MSVRNALPFEFPFRWNDIRRFLTGVPDEAIDYLDQRDRDLEDFLADREPLIFHWTGQVDRHIDVRNGAGKFARTGTAFRIEYVWDIAPATGVTVEWQFDAAVTWTHSLGVTDEDTETEETAYVDQHITAIITAADSTASGLTAFVYLDS